MDDGLTLSWDEDKEGIIMTLDDGHNVVAAAFFKVEAFEKWLRQAEGFARGHKNAMNIKKFIEELKEAKEKKENKAMIEELRRKLNDGDVSV